MLLLGTGLAGIAAKVRLGARKVGSPNVLRDARADALATARLSTKLRSPERISLI
ncbi:MAG TPA: hypothetical protein VM943_02600 [Pyrinomonadaceae bacterium]|nr:hypothetical protein [Pyrinomonadaceae bacterium]